jgi:superfamily I DNA and RNA helicase
MVYAIDAQHATTDFNAVTRRNTLFTAITRSRAWVRITGWGDGMQGIAAEARAVADHHYHLDFPIPSAEGLAQLRHLHRDRTMSEEEAYRRATQAFNAAFEAIEKGDLDVADLPPAIRSRLAIFQKEAADGDG